MTDKNKKKAVEYYLNGLTWAEMSQRMAKDMPNVDDYTRREQLRSYIRCQRKAGKVPDRHNAATRVESHEKVEIDANSCGEELFSVDGKAKCTTVEGNAIGEKTMSGIIALQEGEVITPEIIMNAHNLSDADWDVISYKSNFWQSQMKGGKKITLYQSKITVRPKRQAELTLGEIDELFSNREYKSKPPVKILPKTYGEEMLEIDIADPHIGLLAVPCETGVEYNLPIAKQRFMASINDTVQRVKSYQAGGGKISLIRVVTLGDILHVDNDNNTTTRGTYQQLDGRLSEVYSFALEMLIEAIDTIAALSIPIEFVYTCGNHDRILGYTIVKGLKCAYRFNPNITFDDSPNPQKIGVWGKCLVGYCHGDMNKKNLDQWLIKNYREEYGKAWFSEVHCGHLHSEFTKGDGLVIVRHLPTQCESSYWEHQQGYGSSKALMCFIWDKKHGLTNNWHFMF